MTTLQLLLHHNLVHALPWGITELHSRKEQPETQTWEDKKIGEHSVSYMVSHAWIISSPYCKQTNKNKEQIKNALSKCMQKRKTMRTSTLTHLYWKARGSQNPLKSETAEPAKWLALYFVGGSSSWTTLLRTNAINSLWGFHAPLISRAEDRVFISCSSRLSKDNLEEVYLPSRNKQCKQKVWFLKSAMIGEKIDEQYNPAFKRERNSIMLTRGC